MTITARQTSTRIRATMMLVDKLSALPLAVAEIHRAIDDGLERDDDRQRAEDAGRRSKGGHTDPTADRALQRVGAHERHLDDVDYHLKAIAASAAFLCDVVGQWVVSAANAEQHPRCTGGGTIDDWCRPDCTDYVSYSVRSDGSLSYRQDGLCDSCRMRRHRHERAQSEAVA